jgi:transcriptional regulator of met regulon
VESRVHDEQQQKFVVSLPVQMHRDLRDDAYRRCVELGRHVPMTEVVRDAIAAHLDKRRLG